MIPAFLVPDPFEDSIMDFAIQPAAPASQFRSQVPISLTVGAAVFVDIYIVEAFTDFIYMGGQPFGNKRTLALSRIFATVAQAVRGLSQFYHELCPSAMADVHRLLPSPTYYDNGEPDLPLVFDHHFIYEGRQSGEYRRSPRMVTKMSSSNPVYHTMGKAIAKSLNLASRLSFSFVTGSKGV
jgi:hypothetical protein